jgi:hypothetical protein
MFGDYAAPSAHDSGLRAPFPYFGGKRRVAAEMWSRFGDVDSYVEPFFGSGAVLLARPTAHRRRVETVNDADGLLCNFWRALQHSPDEVARHADWPVSECDLHARHLWLVEQREDITARLMGDPEWHDAKAAGWWVWGACAWIGSGWCSGRGPWVRGEDGAVTDSRKLPPLGNEGRGINRKLPHLGDEGRGIHRQLPHLGNEGRGIHRQLPHLGDEGRGISRQSAGAWAGDLATRMRRVRVACGDWSRVTGPSVRIPTSLPNGAVCGVLLDPPYVEGDAGYAIDSGNVAHDVTAWAIEHGRDPRMRIAVCGYDEHDELAAHGWTPHAWSAKGGYGEQGDGAARTNKHREVVWFSPHCLGAAQPSLL